VRIGGLGSARGLVLALSVLVIGAASAAAIALAARSSGSGSSHSTIKVASSAAAAQGSAEPSSNAQYSNNPHPIAGNFKPDGTKLSSCHEQSCYEQAFGNISYYQGPKAALKLFDEDIAKRGPIESGCHRIAHYIGSAALARYHGNVSKAFAQGSPSCWSGYYHGILERSFYGVSSIKKVAQIARGICNTAEIRRTAWIAYQCVHGLGHGLMIYTGLDLPLALKICDGLATKWDQSSCSGGVFMENITPSFGGTSPWLRKSDLVYPCDVVKERHKLYCYLMVTSRILRANGFNWAATAKICSKVERGWVATCFQSYGRDADGNSRQNPSEDLRLCRIAGSGFSNCLYGAARDMTSNYANGKKASMLCGMAPANERERCFFGIGTVLGGMSPTLAGRRNLCNDVAKGEDAKSCWQGAGAA
jgi:hypothetical protein